MSFPPSSSLCPGYKHVESFGPDEDYEDEEEEVSYVTLDLGSIEPTLVPSSSTYRLVGLDTPTPFLQLSGTILKGRHDSLLGTELIFTDDKETHDWNKRSVVHVANTEQRIAFKEVRLVPKEDKTNVEQHDPFAGLHMIEEAPEPSAVTSSPPKAGTSTVDKIDRLTGKAPPPSRGSRVKGANLSKSAKGKGKGKGKGKQKENTENEGEGDEDEHEDDDENGNEAEGRASIQPPGEEGNAGTDGEEAVQPSEPEGQPEKKKRRGRPPKSASKDTEKRKTKPTPRKENAKESDKIPEDGSLPDTSEGQDEAMDATEG